MTCLLSVSQVNEILPQNNALPMIVDISLLLQHAAGEKGTGATHQNRHYSMKPWSQTGDLRNSGQARSSEDSLGTTKTAGIALPKSHVPRTQSEVQLSLDEEDAERRDANMFCRLVSGIRQRQSTSPHGTSYTQSVESDRSIARIIETRYAQVDSEAGMTRQESFSCPAPTQPFWKMLASTQGRVSEHSETDTWSITGFDTAQQTPLPATTFHEEENNLGDDADDGIFSMDL